MIKTLFSLTNNSPTASIETSSGFKSLKIVAYYTLGKTDYAYNPFIKFHLQNNAVEFTYRAKEIPNTDFFDCSDILLIANQVEALKNIIFTRITIDASQIMPYEVTTISIEVEFEDVFTN